MLNAGLRIAHLKYTRSRRNGELPEGSFAPEISLHFCFLLTNDRYFPWKAKALPIKDPPFQSSIDTLSGDRTNAMRPSGDG